MFVTMFSLNGRENADEFLEFIVVLAWVIVKFFSGCVEYSAPKLDTCMRLVLYLEDLQILIGPSQLQRARYFSSCSSNLSYFFVCSAVLLGNGSAFLCGCKLGICRHLCRCIVC